jgi:hypothetical protein
MYPTTEGPFDNRSTSPVNHDKWVLERRLRAIEGNNLIDLVLVVKICLVQNIVMPKEFRMLDFIKYTKLECHNTYLLSYYNKMAEMIHNNNVTTRLFKPKQRYYTHTHTHILDISSHRNSMNLFPLIIEMQSIHQHQFTSCLKVILTHTHNIIFAWLQVRIKINIYRHEFAFLSY